MGLALNSGMGAEMRDTTSKPGPEIGFLHTLPHTFCCTLEGHVLD